MFLNSLVAEKTFPHTSQFQGTHLQRIGVFLTAWEVKKRTDKLHKLRIQNQQISLEETWEEPISILCWMLTHHSNHLNDFKRFVETVMWLWILWKEKSKETSAKKCLKREFSRLFEGLAEGLFEELFQGQWLERCFEQQLSWAEFSSEVDSIPHKPNSQKSFKKFSLTNLFLKINFY